MHDDELHRFKSDIPLVHYAVARHGYQRDRRESSVSSHVLRHPVTGDKIVVRKDRDGHWTYFSVRDAHDHGTIIDFAQKRGGHRSLGSVREELRQWLGTERPLVDYVEARPARDRTSPAEVFDTARFTASCPYLHARGLRRETLGDLRFAGTWAHDARGNALFVHRDDAGRVTGFEAKNVGFTGFAPGGTKAAWQSITRRDDRALVITESAIDALSHHQLHPDPQKATRYLSTAGAPSRAQFELLERIFSRLPPTSTVVAAVDSDEAGHELAGRIEALAQRAAHVAFRRDAPAGAKDWNEILQRVERDFIRSLPPLRGARGRSERDR
jgi:Toprim-like/Protein of unknown function (DUF3991)